MVEATTHAGLDVHQQSISVAMLLPGSEKSELNASDGSKVGTFTAGGDIGGPYGLVFDGAHIWVANLLGNSVDKL